jgi:hypothetical protein
MAPRAGCAPVPARLLPISERKPQGDAKYASQNISGHQTRGLACPRSADTGHRPDYSLTWSARASRAGGISRPSAVAVFMLTKSANRTLSLPQSEVRPAGDTYLSFSPFAVGAADVAPICPRQLAVQSASALRQPFECTAYDMSLLSVGSSLMLQAISTSKQVTHLLSASEVGAHSRQEPLHCCASVKLILTTAPAIIRLAKPVITTSFAASGY